MKLTIADALFWLIVLAVYLAAWLVLRRWRTDITYVGYLGLITVGFFWRVLFAGAFVPEGGGDMAAILYPVYHFAQENLRQGIVPLWNPYLYAGIPFVGHIQSGPFYPPNLLLFFLTPEVTYRSLEYLLIAHFWLAGVLMYVLLRNLDRGRWTEDDGRKTKDEVPSFVVGRSSFVGISHPAALLGAVVFMFNDFNITHIGNPNMVAVGAWLPLVLLLFLRALRTRRVFFAMLAGAVTGMAYLAGHIQPFLYILFAVGLYALYHTWMLWKRKPSVSQAQSQISTSNLQLPTSNLQSLVLSLQSLLLYLAFTILIAAISLMPNFEMSAQSLRETLSYGDAARFSLPPAEMLGMFVPALFGRGPNIHWGPWERVEVGYVGILPLILATLGAMWRRDSMPRFFLLLALVAFALGMGLYGVVHGWLFLVPGYSQIRVPARFVFLLDFAIAALAAYGFDALLRPLPRRWRAAWRNVFPVLAVVLAAVTLVFVPLMFVAVSLNQSQDPGIFNRTANGLNGLVLFALLLGGSLVLLLARRSRWLSRPLWALAVVVFVFLDLASLGAYLDSGEQDPSANFNHPRAFAFLKGDASQHRIETPESSWFEWQPNLGLITHLDDAAGIYNPLLLQRYARYWSAASARDNVLYDLLNTKYLVVKKDVKEFDPAKIGGGKFTPAYMDDPQVNIWLNQKALPRAFMVYQAKVVASGDEAFAAITAPSFDPTQTIILEGGEALAGAPQQTPTTQVVGRTTNIVVVSVTTYPDGYLFVGNTYYPGWHAILDGVEVPLVRANYLFAAVKVPAGNHQVSLVFDPFSWKLGVGLTALGLMGLLAGWWLIRPNRLPTRKTALHV